MSSKPKRDQCCPRSRYPDRPVGHHVPQESRRAQPLVADTFALYLKTKNFHWHVSGRHFRDYHLLFDEQASAIFGSIDELAERVRKIGGTTLRSIGHIAKLQTLKDNDEAFVPPREMLSELMNDNKTVADAMRKAHEVADKTRTLPPPAFWKTSSTPPRGGPGSCSRRAVKKATTRNRCFARTSDVVN